MTSPLIQNWNYFLSQDLSTIDQETYTRFYSFNHDVRCESCGIFAVSKLVLPIRINYKNGNYFRRFILKYCLDCVANVLVRDFNFQNSPNKNYQIQSSQTNYRSSYIRVVKDERLIIYYDENGNETRTVWVTAYIPNLPISDKDKDLFKHFIYYNSRPSNLSFLPPEIIHIIYGYYKEAVDEVSNFITLLHQIDFNHFIDEVVYKLGRSQT